jgi:hypothetical protein
VKNWWSTLTMRASAAEYRSLPLRGHDLLRDVPLYDVSSVYLPGGGSGRTVADIRALEAEMAPSHIATLLYGLRYFLGRVFGWDREPMRPEDSFLERLSERDRRDSEITPGTKHFRVEVPTLKSLPGSRVSGATLKDNGFTQPLHTENLDQIHLLFESHSRVGFLLAMSHRRFGRFQRAKPEATRSHRSTRPFRRRRSMIGTSTRCLL